ncbi:polyprenyl synthetase family protein [Massilia sp. PWRC2]|uniref:polyprenyl synthetase family protein n=1 Tax=Massilia sp. PWRC2 TaxID=2804626 RepID=UPI003CE8C75C
MLLPTPVIAAPAATFERLLAAVEAHLFESTAALKQPVHADVGKAIAYHLHSGGQRIRARLAIHAGLSLQLAGDDIIALASAVELLHNASLIHDDLQDGDTLRHGAATVWAAFGANTAICAGDLMLAAAYGALGAFSAAARLPALLSLTVARTARAIHGQCIDLSGPTGSDIASYEAMAMAKSGALLSLPTELALLAAGRVDLLGSARRAAESFAVGYQIVDDIEDIGIDANPLKKTASFNIVLLQAGEQAAARAAAVRLAHLHFERAISAAGELPDGSGDLLIALAQRLARRL